MGEQTVGERLLSLLEFVFEFGVLCSLRNRLHSNVRLENDPYPVQAMR
jgi:hypothetical protein